MALKTTRPKHLLAFILICISLFIQAQGIKRTYTNGTMPPSGYSQIYLDTQLKWIAGEWKAPFTGKITKLKTASYGGYTGSSPGSYYIDVYEGGIDSICPVGTGTFWPIINNNYISSVNHQTSNGFFAGLIIHEDLVDFTVYKDSMYTFIAQGYEVVQIALGHKYDKTMSYTRYGYSPNDPESCGTGTSGPWFSLEYEEFEGWYWENGDSLSLPNGKYGIKNLADSNNLPSARSRAVKWVDTQKNVYLFGGEKKTSTQYLNDFWKWDGTNWTWMGGDTIPNQPGVYGTLGTSSTQNKPGARIESLSWTDKNGDFWLFGGKGYNNSGSNGYLNDLWKWDGTKWTWVSGSTAINQPGVYGTKNAPSTNNLPGGRYRAMSWLDANGDLIVFGGQGYDSNGSFGYLNDMWKWDGTNWTWINGSSTINVSGSYGKQYISSSQNIPGSRNRANVWTNSLNETFLFGGQGRDGAGNVGFLNDLWKWDGNNWIWISGDTTINSLSSYGATKVPSNINKLGARFGAVSWIDNSNNLWLFGGYGKDSTSANGHLNDLWQWNGNQWVWMNGSKLADQFGSYKSKGGVSPDGHPGGRYGGISWTDSIGRFWQFGGLGIDAKGNAGKLNDIWRIGYESTINCNLNYSLGLADSISICGDSVILDAGSGYKKYTWNTGDTTQTIVGTYNGLYQINVTDFNNCSASDSVYVSIISDVIHEFDTAICVNDSVEIGYLNNDFIQDTYGIPINNENEYISSSISKDGNVVAFAHLNYNDPIMENGAILIYEKINRDWQQIGQTILGTNINNLLGLNLSLSSNGYTLATSEGSSIKVFTYFNGSWIQKGNSFNAVGYGRCKLSGDGNRIVVSSNNNSVIVYQYSGNSWIQIGNSILNKGQQVTISEDGNTIAISDPDNSNNNGINAGRVSVYKLAGNSWVQLGQLINGENPGDRFGVSIDLSGNGNELMVGSPYTNINGNESGQVKVFEYNNGSWTQKGTSLNGPSAYSSYGLSISISNDAQFISFSDYSSSQLKIFRYLNGDWQLVGKNKFHPNNKYSFLEDVLQLSGNGQSVASVASGLPEIYKDFTSQNSFLWSTGDTTQTIKVSPSSTTTYSLTVSDGIGSCTDDITVFVNKPDSIVQVETACEIYTWLHTGITYNQSGRYNDTLVNIHGCDSIIILDLTIHNSDTTTEAVIACGSFSWPANGQTYFSSGIYETTLVSSSNCDSVIQLHLTINPGYTFGNTAVACNSYTWPLNNQTYTNTGVYYASFQTQNGCDSNYVLSLTINANSNSTLNAIECNSYTWLANGQTYSTTGSYTTNYTNIYGCDSTVTLNLTINQNDTLIQTKTACNSYTWPVNNQTYTSSGIYQSTLTNIKGCDSIVILNLYINTGSPQVQNVTACNAYFWSATNTTYYASGNYTTTLTDSAGCTFQTTLALTIKSASNTTQNITACDEYNWPVSGLTYKTSGNYSMVLTNSQGCDSVLNLNLTINNSTIYPVYQSYCGSYLWPITNQTYTSTGQFSALFTDKNGCDSTITLNLTIHNPFNDFQTLTACDQFNWTVNNQTYNSSGVYSAHFIDKNGCDSNYTIDLTINHNKVSTTPITTCNSYTWPVNGQTYTQGGDYIQVLTAVNGCDSTVILNLSMDNSDTTVQSINTCDSFLWNANNQTYINSGQYFTTLTNNKGCDSVVILNLNITPGFNTTEYHTACNSYTWPLNNQTYTTSGSYSTILASSKNCDSIVNLILTILSPSSSSQIETNCLSYTWPVNGQTYTSSGIYTHTTVNNVGCDSVITLSLSIYSSPITTQNISSCNSYTWPVNNNTYVTSGIYSDTLVNTHGCDSIVQIDLTISPSYFQSITINSCNSYTWHINGATYNLSGAYAAKLTSSSGCDSSFVLYLTINKSTTSTINVTACNSYTWPATGLTYSNSGAYSININRPNKCDSIANLNLAIVNPDTSIVNVTSCGDYLWSVNNQNYNSTGTYFSVLTNVNGCDSVIQLDLTINPTNGSNLNNTVCDSYTWPLTGNTYTNSGSYSITLNNKFGCDSIVTLHLTVNTSKQSTISVNSCNFYVWPLTGSTYSSSGNYQTTIPSSNGCDSTVTLALQINRNDTVLQTITTCSSYTWPTNSQTYNSSGEYSASFTNINGCDSIVKLDLTITSTGSLTQNISACDSFTWAINNQTYSNSGSYTSTIIDSSGCSILATLNLTILTSTSTNVSATSCDSYFWPLTSTTYYSSGNYIYTEANYKGCDSTITLDLTITNSDTTKQTVSTCNSYIWPVDNQTYYSSGIYTVTLQNSKGCDSLIELNLKINYDFSDTIVETSCENYTWVISGQSYTSSGIYTAPYISQSGCDSVYILNLTILPSKSSMQYETACSSYLWPINNLTYISSGVYTTTTLNSNGCDSIITLNLTVNHPDTTIQNISSCNNYTWQANGQTYTSSGTFTAALTNIKGCDSIVTLNLIITNDYILNQTVVSCGSYTWPINNQTYTTSGNYSSTINNPNGCDTLVTLNLSIDQYKYGIENKTVCKSYTWPINNQTYNNSGIYTDTLNILGSCDSIVTLNLTIIPSDSIYQTVSACGSYTWLVNNQVYTSTGVYNILLTNSTGCDSLVYLDLKINQNYVVYQNVNECDSFYWNVTNQYYSSSTTTSSVLQSSSGCDSTITLNLTINKSSSSTIQQSSCNGYFWPVNGQTYTQSGNYAATITNGKGCDSTINLQLTINKASIDNQPQNRQVFIYDTASFTVTSSQSNLSYQWQSNIGFGYQDLNNAGQYDGTNTNTLLIYNSSITNNNQVFRCIVSSTQGCKDTSNSAVLTVINNISIVENKNNNLIRLYPNPTTDIINVEIDKSLIGKHYYITDQRGRIILEGALQNELNQINVDTWSSGDYIFNVTKIFNAKFSVFK